MNSPVIPNRDALLKRLSTMKQLAGVRRASFEEGRERGLRTALFDNGSGLSFTVLMDKCLDLGEVRYKGVPLGWISPCGFQTPDNFNENGLGWLRSWGGGLLTTCGLRNVGAPGEFDGEPMGLHGRISNTPAENSSVAEKWMDGSYEISATGTMRETRMFGENLLLTRKVSTTMGVNTIEIKDKVENQAHKSSQAEILYHINLGWPLLDSCSALEAPPHEVTPRDATAATGLEAWNRCQEPTPGFTEQCFYHDLPADSEGMSGISLLNPKIGLKLTVSFRKAELPFLTQWKQMGEGEFVTGLEPANCHVEGATRERDHYKTLKILQPGESFETLVRISVEEFYTVLG